MTTGPSIHAAVEHLRSQQVVFEPGLTGDEIARVEAVCHCRLPADFRQFLQAALPVTGGFPNWRSESEDGLRHRYLDRPAQGILFDVEHNDFWPEGWGPRPAGTADALAKAGRRLRQAPPLIPVRSHHFLPARPPAEGNPIFSVRQSDVTRVGRDPTPYLLSLFGPDGQPDDSGVAEWVIPFGAVR
jgi:hypothetical protein